MEPGFDARDLRKAFGRFATGVTVVTTLLPDGQRIGVTANSFTSVSISPPLISWNYRREALGLAAFLQAPHFAVHVLGQHQLHLSPQFASPVADRFVGVELETGFGGVPLIKDCAATFECCQWSTVDAGDHVILLGQVLRYMHSDAPPLVFHAGGYLQWPQAQCA
ncbi:Nitrilotriacetate monooxygenase component B [plant metagenome]|uniref:Nitrilotriacetate monooxygenase component B n=1 Tax=plant metagenome TaxID=1297885 RepID=A0A484Q7G3_9ZZZZ